MKKPDLHLKDEMLHRITGSIFLGYGILIAYKLGLFNLLSSKSLSTEEIAPQLNLSLRPTQALISAASAYDLLKYENGKYGLSPIGVQYLTKESPSYFGDVLDLYIAQIDHLSFKNIESAVVTDLPQVYSGGHLFDVHKDSCFGRQFTNSMHHKSYNSAYSWPKHVEMKSSDILVDIGAGSGIHSIAACQCYPMEAIICDLKEILPFAYEKVLDAGLEKQISLQSIDMWTDPFPEGTIHFYSDIFHDWSPEKCQFLAKKSYEALPKDGRIILNEMLFDEGKEGPELTSAYNLKMLYWTEGQQFSKKEIAELLKKAGFKKIKIKNYFGGWSLVIGEKIR